MSGKGHSAISCHIIKLPILTEYNSFLALRLSACYSRLLRNESVCFTINMSIIPRTLNFSLGFLPMHTFSLQIKDLVSVPWALSQLEPINGYLL